MSLSVSWVGSNGQTLAEALVSMKENYIKKDGFHSDYPEADQALAMTQAQADNIAPLESGGVSASGPLPALER